MQVNTGCEQEPAWSGHSNPPLWGAFAPGLLKDFLQRKNRASEESSAYYIDKSYARLTTRPNTNPVSYHKAFSDQTFLLSPSSLNSVKDELKAPNPASLMLQIIILRGLVASQSRHTLPYSPPPAKFNRNSLDIVYKIEDSKTLQIFQNAEKFFDYSIQRWGGRGVWQETKWQI